MMKLRALSRRLPHGDRSVESRGRVSRLACERGEGVVSVAIAVLIVAFLGVALYVAFSGVLDDMTGQVESQIEQIGDG